MLYLYHISANHPANGWDWLIAVVYMIVSMFFVFYIIEQRLLGSKNSPYPFDPDEMERGGVMKKLELARR
jgi:hypothetical protein